MSIEELYNGRGERGDANPSIDMVAIHGLNPYNSSDHAVATWTDESSGHLWLRDSLPHSQPNARILLYAYESSPAFGIDKERFKHQANSLLECLRLVRRNDPGRPLIMMGHSLGGILIKQALVNAHNNPKYSSIKEATFGLVFFGTPHAGPSNDLMTKFEKACVAIAQSMPWNVSNDIMEALKKGSLFSDVLEDDWKHQLGKYHFVSFYEGIGSTVPRDSAVLGLQGDRESPIRLNADHSNICRFNPSVKVDKDNYFYVEGNIADLCNLCPVSTTDAKEFRHFLWALRRIGSNPRHEKISQRHQDSFRWIWEHGADGPGFVDWLNSDLPIYWLTGLPGSGKSTLMNYLHDASMNHLSLPPGHIMPILMGYFFHELGESQEQTFESFLASFLAQLLAVFESLADLVLPLFHQPVGNHPMDEPSFDIKEHNLIRALRLVAEQRTVTGSVVLFLDGLDECSGNNRTQVDFLAELAELSNKGRISIRMCLASRTLPEIEPRLGLYPRCHIHEWTATDISEYISANFRKAWERLGNHQAEEDLQDLGLIKSIVGKAGGVFLWVELVVDNLIIGLEEGDTSEELMERLESLPSDLEHLYARIIQQIPLRHIHDTIDYINILLGSWPGKPLSLITFALAVRDPKKALEQTVQWTEDAPSDLQKSCEQVERRIKSRCRGLIHVRKTSGVALKARPEPLAPSIGKMVEFLHLTVVKYIRRTEVAESMIAKVDKSLIIPASLRLESATLATLKTIPPEHLFSNTKGKVSFPYVTWAMGHFGRGIYTQTQEPSRFRGAAFALLLHFFSYARDAQDETEFSQRVFMKEIDRICTLGSETWCMRFHGYICEGGYHDITGPKPNRKFANIDLHCICLCMDIESYLREELESYGYNPKERQGRPLVNFIVDGTGVRPGKEWTMRHGISALKLLHKYGASTNQIFQEKTSWQYALDMILGKHYRKNGIPLLIAMLDCGSDPNQRLPDYQGSPLVAALREIWHYDFEDVTKLIGSFIKHGVDLGRDLDDILRKAEWLNLKLKIFIEEKIAEREKFKSKERPSRYPKRKRTEVAIRTGKRRANGT